MLSCADDSSNVTHLIKLHTGRIRMLLRYENILSDQRLHPADGLFRYTSVSADEHDSFRVHPDDLTMLSKAMDD